MRRSLDRVGITSVAPVTRRAPAGVLGARLRAALGRAALLGPLAALAGAALAAAAVLPASAAAAATPIALDAPDNGSAPLIAYDPTTATTYVAWSDPHFPGVDLCVLPAGATGCDSGAPVLLEDSKYAGYSATNHPGLGGLVVLPGGEAVVIGTPVSEGSIAWASPAGGAAFLSGEHGLRNAGQFISPVSLFYTFGNAVALSTTDVGLLDDYGNFFSDSPLTAESPAIAVSNTNPGEQYPRKALFTNGPEIAAEAAPAPAAAGTEIVVGVGSNNSSAQLTPKPCLNDAASGYGVSVGNVNGTSKAAGTLNHEGLPAYQLLACSAEAPVVASGGTDGIGVLEQEGSGVSGAGSDFALDYRPFDATASGGTFGPAVELSDVTSQVLDGVDALDVSDDSATGVYALWEDGQGTVLDYSANGGGAWEGPTVAPPPYGGDDVIAGTGAGNAEIAYDNNPGTGDQVFLQPVNYQALVAENAKPKSSTPTTPVTPAPTPPDSDYTIKSIVANSNGTVTITFVPADSGEATLVVTVPTASIASTSATAAKAKKCKHGQIKFKGKCLPVNTVTGKTHGHGTAGVALKLTVNLSSKVKALLKHGKTVHLTAKLTYASSLGGAPTVKIFHLTAKGKKPKHH